MYYINKNYMFRPIEAIIRFCPVSYRSSTYIFATAYQWWDLTSVTCWAGISDLIPSGGWGVIWLGARRMGGLMPLVVGEFIAGMTVAETANTPLHSPEDHLVDIATHTQDNRAPHILPAPDTGCQNAHVHANPQLQSQTTWLHTQKKQPEATHS
jgi:hypothetical protein